VAIALNLAIALTLMLPWLSMLSPEGGKRFILAIALFAGIILVLAAIAQLLLTLKTPKRVLWTYGTIALLIVVPFLVLQTGVPFLDSTSWLLSAAPWAAVGMTPAITILFSVLTQFTVVGLLSYRLTRQLQKAGASELQGLLKA
jgi:hypothetical protein